MGWSSFFYETERNSTTTKYKHNILNLTPYTDYAYFVTAQVVNNVNEQFVLNVTQGLSDIGFFKTLPDIPNSPLVRTVSKTPTSFHLKWSAPVPVREWITYYSVDIFIQPDSLELLDGRDYCEFPREDQTVMTGQAKRIPPKESIQCDAETSAGLNATEAERAATSKKRKVDCLLWNERQTYERRLLDWFNDEENGQCEPGDRSCEQEYNSFRFKRDLDAVVTKNDDRSYDHMASHLSESSLIRKRSIFETIHHMGNLTFQHETRNATIPNLKPFTLYTLHFFACNTFNCSSYYMHNERTDIQPSADDVMMELHMDEEVGNIVYLDFREPKQPNGMTVAFIVEQHDMEKAKMFETCISMKQHMQRNYR